MVQPAPWPAGHQLNSPGDFHCQRFFISDCLFRILANWYNRDINLHKHYRNIFLFNFYMLGNSLLHNLHFRN